MKTQLHIAIDITPLGSLAETRGVGAYTRELVSALKQYASQHEYTFFVRGEKLPTSVDLVHYPYFDPFFLTLPLLSGQPVVVTVHDLIPLVFTAAFPSGARGRLKWLVQKTLLKRAAAVITDSRASKVDIHKITGIQSDKIAVIPLAAGSQFERVTDKNKLKMVSDKYKLPQDFFLYVGDINWNKNIPGLLAGFHKLSLSHPSKLVLAGKAFLDLHLPEAQEIDFLIRDLHIESSVLRPGFIEMADLPAIYTLAKAYVQPSLAEGFGLPVLEAFACGTPVISSNRSSLLEISGPAVRIDPDDPESLAQALAKAAVKPLTPTERDKYVIWARQFSWEQVAHKTVAVYESVS